MKYEKSYELSWTWHYLDSTYDYSEFKVFDTEIELNKFQLELFCNPYIEIVWCEKKRVETWKRKRGNQNA